MGVIRTFGLKADAVLAATCIVRNPIRVEECVLIHRACRRQRDPYHCFALLDVLFSEQELAVEVGEVYSVEVEKCDVTEASENDILHYVMHSKDGKPNTYVSHNTSDMNGAESRWSRTEFATNTTRANKEDLGLREATEELLA